MVKLEKILSLVGKNWKKYLTEEEIEQERLIVQWKDPNNKDVENQVHWNLLLRQYAMVKTSGRMSSIECEPYYIPQEDTLVTLDDFLNNEVLKRASFSMFERYVTYLLYHHKKTEVAEILQCRLPYLSKLISSLKVRLASELSSSD